jgi:hypothetical protein
MISNYLLSKNVALKIIIRPAKWSIVVIPAMQNIEMRGS